MMLHLAKYFLFLVLIITSSTVTLSVGGVFAEKTSEIRKEFLNLARSG